MDHRREGNLGGCTRTAAHVGVREPSNFQMYDHKISLVIELDFVPRMGTLGVPLALQKDLFWVIIASLVCPFRERQA